MHGVGIDLNVADFVKSVATDRTATEILAEFAADLTWETIPAEVRERAKHLLIDIIGVGLAGSTKPAFAPVVEALARLGAEPGVSLIGFGQKLSAPNAVLVNGMTSHVLDWDDTHMATIVHASSVIVPAALAAGELAGADPRTILTAMVAGYEVMTRIGLGADPLDWWSRGFHGTSVLGVFGAAVTAGKIFGLDAEGLVNAMGLAASQAGGIQQYASPGEVNDAKRFHSGWPASCGLVAAGLAQAGLTAPRQVLEGVRSLYKTHLGRAARDEAAITADLGERWETLRISVKVFPCCQGFQAPMEVTRRLHQRLGAERVERIAEVRIGVPPGQRTLIEPVEAKRRPQSHPTAVIAMQFCIGTMLARGEITLADFSPERLRDPAALALADKVLCHVDPALPARFDGASVTVVMQDGSELTEAVDCYRGGPGNPLPQDEFRRKFVGAAATVLGAERSAAVADILFDIDNRRSGELFAAMRA